MTDFNTDIPQIDEKENPISKASFESIDELFNKDPQFYTPENLAIICETLRAGRGKWIQSASAKKTTSAKGKAKLSPEQAKALLDNLVIDI